MRAVLFLGACLALSPQNLAEAFETKALYRFCKGQVDEAAKSTANSVCGAYIRGVVDGLIVGGVIEQDHVFCPPKEGIDADRAKDIVVGYMTAHPEIRTQEAGMTASVAIVEAFRCPKSANPN